MANIVFLLMFILASVGSGVIYTTGYSRWIYFFKPLIVISLLGLYICNTADIKPELIMALVFALSGDVFLINSSRFFRFVTGMFSFLCMHALYIVYIFYYQINEFNTGINFYILSFLLLLTGIFIFLRLHPIEKLIKIFLPVYILALIFLTMACYQNLILNPSEQSVIQFSGAIFFMVSDTVLATAMFGRAVKNSSLIVIITYALAQLFLVAGFIKYQV